MNAAPHNNTFISLIRLPVSWLPVVHISPLLNSRKEIATHAPIKRKRPSSLPLCLIASFIVNLCATVRSATTIAILFQIKPSCSLTSDYFQTTFFNSLTSDSNSVREVTNVPTKLFTCSLNPQNKVHEAL